MPRPLVEVRQSVLNPVVTINDPQQQVCLVGLHTKDVKEKVINNLDRVADVADGATLHVDANLDDNLEISVVESGTIINQDIDLGEDAYDIEGDLSATLRNVKVSELDITGYSNMDDDASAFRATQILLDTVALLDSYASHSISDLSVVLQPVATHLNKLVPSTNSTVNFSTGEIGSGNNVIVEDYLRDLVVGSAVYMTVAATDHKLIVLRKDADALYLRGATAAAHAILVSANASNFTLFKATDTGAKGDAIPDATFDLKYPGKYESQLSSLESDGTNYSKVNLEEPMFFAVRVDEASDAEGALLYNISEDVDIASGDLSIELTSTGADYEIVRTALVATPSYSGATPKKIVKADVVTSYTVALNSYSSAITTVDSNTRSTILGAASSTNSLSLAAEMALLNSGNSSITVLALDLSPEEGSTVPRSVKSAFSQALGILNRSADVYAMVPLTQDLSVAKQYANAADSLSSPTKGKFRICLGTSPGAPTVEYIIGSASSPSTSGAYVHADTVLTDSVNSFKRTGSTVLIGDSITITQGNNVFTGSISGVTNTSLTVDWDTGSAPSGNIDEVAAYFVTRTLLPTTKISRQIELLAADAAGVAAKRLFITFPGKCSVASADVNNTLTNAPGYYLTAAFAGLLARLEIHRPKNFIGVQGVTSLADWNRFSDDQLDQISDAGYLVFQQEEATSTPFCVHQVNSFHGQQAGTQEFTELSVLSNFDFVSRYFKDILNPFAGTVNIVPSTLGIIRGSLESGIANLLSRRVATIGAPLISGSIDHIRQSAVDDGTVETQITVSLPKVLNKITIDVVSG